MVGKEEGVNTLDGRKVRMCDGEQIVLFPVSHVLWRVKSFGSHSAVFRLVISVKPLNKQTQIQQRRYNVHM